MINTPTKPARWHFTIPGRTVAAFGVSGLSVAVDSLSAIKFAKVTPVRNEDGIAVDFKVEGDFPKYGNDDDRADDIAVELVSFFSAELKNMPCIEMPSTHCLLLPLRAMLCTAKRQEPPLTEENQANPLLQEPTQCTDAIPMVL